MSTPYKDLFNSDEPEMKRLKREHNLITIEGSTGSVKQRPEKCIHCDSAILPTGPDDWCYCRCHDTDRDF